VIGDLLAGTDEILRRLTAVGWGSRVVRTLREARDLFNTFDFQVVLASESLPDGRGYDLADSVSRRSRTLMVGVPLSESCLGFRLSTAASMFSAVAPLLRRCSRMR
jgi:hypothetical protein